MLTAGRRELESPGDYLGIHLRRDAIRALVALEEAQGMTPLFFTYTWAPLGSDASLMSERWGLHPM